MRTFVLAENQSALCQYRQSPRSFHLFVGDKLSCIAKAAVLAATLMRCPSPASILNRRKRHVGCNRPGVGQRLDVHRAKRAFVIEELVEYPLDRGLRLVWAGIA